MPTASSSNVSPMVLTVDRASKIGLSDKQLFEALSTVHTIDEVWEAADAAGASSPQMHDHLLVTACRVCWQQVRSPHSHSMGQPGAHGRTGLHGYHTEAYAGPSPCTGSKFLYNVMSLNFLLCAADLCIALCLLVSVCAQLIHLCCHIGCLCLRSCLHALLLCVKA